MIKLKEILLKEATYVKGKLYTLLTWARRYMFDEGSIGNQTFWNKWTKESIIHNVTESFSVKDGLKDGSIKPASITKFQREIDKAFDVARKDVEKAYSKWEKSVERATKPFDDEYTGV